MLTDQEAQEEARYAYVPEANAFMAMALERVDAMQRAHPEANHPTCSVIVKDGAVVVIETGRQVHSTFCPRVALGSLSGKDYEYCPDHCHSDNHSEAHATRLARERGIDRSGAEVYLGGHWWACGPCFEKMEALGIAKVYLVNGAKEAYNDTARRADPDRARSGMMRTSLTVYVAAGLPHDAEKFSGWLTRVGITALFGDEGLIEKADALILLTRTQGSEVLWHDLVPQFKEQGRLHDFRKIKDLRYALVCLSRDLVKPLPLR